jgi:tetratricopeptide (TPR) repeat protein
MAYTPLQLAEAFIQTGELQDALDALNQHLEANSSDDDARRLRVQVLMRTSDDANLRLALDDLSHLTSPSSDDSVQKSIVYERLGDLSLALEEITNIWSLNIADDRLTERYLRLFVAQGEIGKAIIMSLLLPKTWRWLQWRGDLEVMGGMHEAAIQHYSDAFLHLGEQFNLDIDQWGRAIQARLLLARADAYTKLSKYLNRPEPTVDDLSGESVRYKFVRAAGHTIENTLANADADYLVAQSIIPTDPMIPFKRGLLAALQGDEAQAKNLCRAAWADANDVLHEEMGLALAEDEHFASLALLLNP